MVVLRTFSKLHGLAGLRIGYAIAPAELAQRLAALSLTWPNSTGLSAAIASFNDHAFLKATRAALTGDRTKVHATLDRLGLDRADAQGNFVFFDTGGPLQRFQDRMLAEGSRSVANSTAMTRGRVSRSDCMRRSTGSCARFRGRFSPPWWFSLRFRSRRSGCRTLRGRGRQTPST